MMLKQVTGVFEELWAKHKDAMRTSEATQCDGFNVTDV